LSLSARMSVLAGAVCLLALATGDAASATDCLECHGGKTVPADSARAASAPFLDPAELEASVHAGFDCVECHGGGFEEVPHPASAARRAPDDACGECHPEIEALYRGSLHGIVRKYGAEGAPTCSDCHGSHEVLPPRDPASSVHPGSLAATCGKCHGGAGGRFVGGRVHVGAVKERSRALFYVHRVYIVFIAVLIALFVLHAATDAAAQLRRWRSRPAAPPGPPVQRLGVSLRVQHALLFSSFFVLVGTGLPLKFHDAQWASFIVSVLGGVGRSRLIHRVAASGLIGVGVYHLLYVALSPYGRWNFLQLRPTRRDFGDLFRQTRYYLGLSSRGARFGRFSYVQKFDYWAVYWGMAIMVCSGAMLWFDELTLRFLPRYALDIARQLHSDEALLAVLAIVIWHFYNVHFNPRTFPMSRVWLTGKIARAQMEEEHPLEYEEMLSASSAGGKRAAARGAESDPAGEGAAAPGGR